MSALSGFGMLKNHVLRTRRVSLLVWRSGLTSQKVSKDYQATYVCRNSGRPLHQLPTHWLADFSCCGVILGLANRDISARKQIVFSRLQKFNSASRKSFIQKKFSVGISFLDVRQKFIKEAITTVRFPWGIGGRTARRFVRHSAKFTMTPMMGSALFGFLCNTSPNAGPTPQSFSAFSAYFS